MKKSKRKLIITISIIAILICTFILVFKIANQSYKEEKIDYKSSGFYKQPVMSAEFESGSNEEAASYYWIDETGILENGMRYKSGCVKLFWQDGKMISEKVDFGESAELIKSPGKIFVDENGVNFVMSYDDYFTVIDKDGKLIKQINIDRLITEKLPNGYSPSLFWVDGEVAYILYERRTYESDENSACEYYMTKIQWRTREYLSACEINGADKICLFNEYLYGYDEDKNMVVIDMNNNLIQSVSKPSGFGQVKIAKNDNGIFYMNSSGIYVMENCDNKFEKLVSSFGKKSISNVKDVASFYVDEEDRVYVVKNVMDSFDYYLLEREE